MIKHDLSVFFITTVKEQLYLVTEENFNTRSFFIHGSEYKAIFQGYLIENPEHRSDVDEEILLRLAQNNRNCFIVINTKKDFLKPKIYKIK